MILWRMLLANGRSMLRDRGALAVALILPAGLALLFGMILRVNVKPSELGVILEGRDDPTAASFVSALKSARDDRGNVQFHIAMLRSESEARKRFESDEIDAALLVPDLENGGKVTLLFDERNVERLQRISGPISAVVQTFNLRAVGGTERVRLAVRGLRADTGLGEYNGLLPMILMFGVLFGNFGYLAQKLVSEREQGVHKRLFLTPLRPRTYLLSEVSARMALAVVQTALILAIGVGVFDATIVGNPAWIFLLALIATVSFSSLAILVVSAAKSPEQAGGLTTTLSLILFFISGPGTSELFPDAVKRIGSLLPLGPVMTAMRTVVLDGKNPFSLNLGTVAVALWTLVPLALAPALFKFAAPRKGTT